MCAKKLYDLAAGLGFVPLEESPAFAGLDEFAEEAVRARIEWARDILADYSLPPDCGLSHVTGATTPNAPTAQRLPRPASPPSQFAEGSKEWFAASVIEETEQLGEAMWLGDYGAVLFAALRIGALVETARHKFKEDQRLQQLHAGRLEGAAANSRKGKKHRKCVVEAAKKTREREPLLAETDTQWAKAIRKELPDEHKMAISTIRQHLRMAREDGQL